MENSGSFNCSDMEKLLKDPSEAFEMHETCGGGAVDDLVSQS